MGCLQSKEKGYSIPDQQSNEINNPMKEETLSVVSTPDKPLSPKELLMIKKSESNVSNVSGEDIALLDTRGDRSSSTPPPPQRDSKSLKLSGMDSSPQSSPGRTVQKSVSSPKRDVTPDSKKLSVSELLIQEKMKKKHSGKSSAENEVRILAALCVYFLLGGVDMSNCTCI